MPAPSRAGPLATGRYGCRVAPNDVVLDPLALDRHTLDDVAVLGARGFFDDPFFMYLSADARLRARGLAIFVRSHLAVLGDRAVAVGARNEAGILVGVSVWQRPGTYPLPALAQARELVGSFRALVPRPPALRTGLRYVTAMERVRPRDEHWYLALLVTDPMLWRRGVGTALLEPTLASIDTEGLPCYLETQKEANLAFYRRFGFDLTERLEPNPGGPPLFTLTRPAR